MIKLSDLLEKIFPHEEHQQFYCEICSFIVPEPGKFVEFVDKLSIDGRFFPNRNPASVVIGDFSSIEIVTSSPIPYVDDKARLVVLNNIRKVDIPKANSALFVSPIPIDGGNANHSTAADSISILKSFFTLNFGTLTNYSNISSFVVHKDGKITSPGGLFRIPQSGDLFKIFDFDISSQILERMKLQSKEFLSKYEISARFVSRALQENEESVRFTLYWTALEVLSGTANQIRAAIAQAYRNHDETVQEIGKNIGFSTLSQMRHDLFHFGRFKKFTAKQERLMHLIYWDIVIDKIGLPHQGFAALLNEKVEDDW